MPVSRRGFLRTLSAGTVAGSLTTWVGSRSSAAALFTPRSDRNKEGFLLLDSNENAYGPSDQVMAAIRASLGTVNRYSLREYEALSQDIARSHKIDSDRVILGCGSTEVLRVAAAALLGRGKKLITATPTFEDLGSGGCPFPC